MASGTWTDERLEDLVNRVDSGFDRADRQFLDIRGEIRAMRSDLTGQSDALRSDLTAQIDSLRSLTIRLSLGTTLAVLVAIATRSL
ncbi:MAG: hypothetical protein JJE13_02005 [Thermoleophilia bacterium]|nr:hypothetical protein [Thermoleophilia bacterium]